MRISDWSSDVCSSDLFGLGTSDLAAIATLAPSRAARSAIARPMPREAPVMKRVWLLRVGMEREWGMGDEGNEGNEASLALSGRRGVDRKSTRLNSSH